MSYTTIYNFGTCNNNQKQEDNPLGYCIGNSTVGQRLASGSHADSITGQESRQCQHFLSEYCASNWDNHCELASRNTNKMSYPDTYSNTTRCNLNDLTIGESHIVSTAERKYLYKMRGAVQKHEPFDATVATSPLITYWEGFNPIPEYIVDPSTIDDDIVMNKILEKPQIATQLLYNIYTTMKRYGVVGRLDGTELGKYYTYNGFRLV